MDSYRDDIYSLIFASINGVASDEQERQLSMLLEDDPDARKIYVDYVMMFTLFYRRSGISIFVEDEIRDYDFGDPDESAIDAYDLSEESSFMQVWREMAEYEKIAPAVVIPEEEPRRELIQKVVYPPRQKYKFTKFQKFYFAASAAIILFFSMLVMFSSDNLEPPVVAELADSIGADWDEGWQKPGYSGELVQSTYKLKSGFVSILFKSGAKVTIEAPAKWSLMMGGGDMELFGGRIYAVVPERAHGFTVIAGGSKIVDLGTEFGVEMDEDNNTQLHVTKGKTLLFAGFLNGKKSPVNVNAGDAKKVYSDGFIKDIDVGSRHFVREIRKPYGTLLVLNADFEKFIPNREIWDNSNKADLWSAPPWITKFKHVGTNTWMLDTSPNGGAVTPSVAYGYGGNTGKGKSLGYIKTDPKSDHCLQQDLSFALQSSRTYDLSVKVGNPSGFNEGPGAAYRVELLAGGAVIASDSGSSPADDSKWITARVRYTSGSDKKDDPNIGQYLAIRLVAEAFTEGKHINFDGLEFQVKAGAGND